METIKVKEIARYRDGGTTRCVDKKGNSYYIDNRIGSTTIGKVFDEYPDDGKMIDVKLEIVKEF